MATRKKWSTRNGGEGPRRNHKSKTAVYDWIPGEAVDLLVLGVTRHPLIHVYVDEGIYGWQLYDIVDLNEYTSHPAVTAARSASDE